MTPRPTPVLETARLRLRPGGAADAEALHSAFADPELMRWWSNAPHVSIEQTRADLAQQAPEWRRWIVTLKNTLASVIEISTPTMELKIAHTMRRMCGSWIWS